MKASWTVGVLLGSCWLQRKKIFLGSQRPRSGTCLFFESKVLPTTCLPMHRATPSRILVISLWVSPLKSLSDCQVPVISCIVSLGLSLSTCGCSPMSAIQFPQRIQWDLDNHFFWPDLNTAFVQGYLISWKPGRNLIPWSLYFRSSAHSRSNELPWGAKRNKWWAQKVTDSHHGSLTRSLDERHRQGCKRCFSIWWLRVPLESDWNS